jgi:hypothetical protein
MPTSKFNRHRPQQDHQMHVAVAEEETVEKEQQEHSVGDLLESTDI